MDMAFQFNAQQYAPSFAGGSSGLPVGRHPVVITDADWKDTKGNDGSKMLVLVATAIDGPAKGETQDIRLNVQNASATASRIAYGQLSAICAVCGLPQGIQQAISEIWNKPFILEMGLQRETEANKGKGYTEPKNVYFIDGRDLIGKPMAPQTGPVPQQAAQQQPVPQPGPGAFAQPQPQQPFVPQQQGFAATGAQGGYAPQQQPQGGFAPQQGGFAPPQQQPAPQAQPGGFGGFPQWQGGFAPQAQPQQGLAPPNPAAPWGAR